MPSRLAFRAHVKTITAAGRAFAEAIGQTVVPIRDDDLEEELPDLLGDAADGDFDFLRFDDDEGPAFAAGVEPIAFLGGPGDEPLQQIEGLLLARSAGGGRGAVTELFTVAVSGTLAPGTEKVVGTGFASLRLRAPAGAGRGAGGEADDDEDDDNDGGGDDDGDDA